MGDELSKFSRGNLGQNFCEIIAFIWKKRAGSVYMLRFDQLGLDTKNISTIFLMEWGIIILFLYI